MDEGEAIRRLHQAYDALLAVDRQLLEFDANERSITHKLAEHLQVEFPDWHVDCEYNRHRREPKRVNLQAKVAPDDTNATTVFPDIVIHRRDTTENLMAIEAKKTSRPGVGYDDQKLAAYLRELGYKFAFKVTFPVGDRASQAAATNDIMPVVRDRLG